MRTVSISFSEIQPAVRYAGVTVVTPEEPLWVRLTYDHRLIYAMSPGAAISIGDESFEMKNGSVLLFQSGTPYRIDTRGQNIPFYLVNFDFCRGEIPVAPGSSLPMTSPSSYQPEKRMEQALFSENFLRSPCFLPDMESLAPYLEQMAHENSRAELLCAEQLSALCKICLNMIFRRSQQYRSERPDSEDLLLYIGSHLAEPLDNRSVGEVFHYHPNYVSQLVRARTGLPLHRYLLSLRIRRATELIQSGNLPISEIAAQVGFRDASYFSQYFRRLTGRTPGEFRRYRQEG